MRLVVVGSRGGARPRKHGPKTAEGRLAVRLNASTHGILSPQPVVLAYEKPEDWENHRAAIVDSLAPEGGLEEVLAGRVALVSWRLNRVTLYEAERLQEGQDGVVEAVRQERLREGRIEAIYEGLDPDSPSVAMKAHPLNVLDDLKVARAVYKAVCRLPDASEEDVRRVEVGYGAVVLNLAAIEAIKMVDQHAGRAPDEREVHSRAEALLERLPSVPEASLDDADVTLGRLKSLVGWLAREAGMPPDVGTGDGPVDGSVDPPEDRLLERV